MCLIFLGAGAYAIRATQIRNRAKHLTLLVEERTKDLRQAKEHIEQALTETENARIELANTNTRLDKANKEKSDLLGILSHDLKNKVVSLKNYTDAMKEQVEKNSSINEFAPLLEQTTLYMLKLIDDTLSSAALEQGQLLFTSTALDVVSLVELVTMRNRILMQKKNQTINFEARFTEECTVLADERWLNEAIDNIINNASKFSQPGTEVNVFVEKNESIVRIIVKDQGPGFTEEDKTHLFKQFKRLSAQPTGGEVSTGLGLAIVKKIIDMHNGKSIVESVQGIGTKFIIELPIIPQS